MPQSDKNATRYYTAYDKKKEINKNNLDDYSRFYVVDSNNSKYMVRNPNYNRENNDEYSRIYYDEDGNIISNSIDKYTSFIDEDDNEYRQYKCSLFGKSQNTNNENENESQSYENSSEYSEYDEDDSDEQSSTNNMIMQPPAPAPAPAQIIRPVAENTVRQSKLSTHEASGMDVLPITPITNHQNDIIDIFVRNNIYYKNFNSDHLKLLKPRSSKNRNIKFMFNNNNELSAVMIENCIYTIGKMIGKSRALVYEITSSNLNINVKLCLKIAEHGNISFNYAKLGFIEQHQNDYAQVYNYSSNVTFDNKMILDGYDLGNSVDICVLEQIDNTLDQLCDDLRNQEKGLIDVKTFSFKFLSYLTKRLIEIATTLITNGLYYADMKAANIGITMRDSQYSVKLIDVDTINSFGSLSIGAKSGKFVSTDTTTGRIAPNINIVRIQYLNIFFTIFSLLFLDDYKTMCSNKYNQFYRGKMYNYMSWVNNDKRYTAWMNTHNTDCEQYKYALLIGTYKIIEDYGGIKEFNNKYIYAYYNDILQSVYNVIMNNGRCVQSEYYNYFMFIAHCLVIMVAIFTCPLNEIISTVFILFEKPYVDNGGSGIPNTFNLYDDIYENVMLDAETSIGVSVVNALRKYAVGYCMDETCEALQYYIQRILDIDTINYY